MLGQSPKANPILSETTDCIQSSDYLHSKPDLLVNLDSSARKDRNLTETILGRRLPPHCIGRANQPRQRLNLNCN
jgi:hypothetical protein